MSGFTCPFCHLIFLLRTELENHVLTDHPERRPPPPDSRRSGRLR
jgi:hypothetical protein